MPSSNAGVRIPQAKHVFCPGIVSCVTMLVMYAQCQALSEALTSSVCPSWRRYPQWQHFIGGCHKKL